MKLKKKIVTIGGGKGQATLLSGLRNSQDNLHLSAIVSMVDNGGSTGRFREELNIPPFGGDFKDVMTSLSNNQALVDLFHHRYEHGNDIKGHTVGNLILLGLLEKAEWDIPEAIKVARKILSINAHIYPSTLDKVHLVAEYKDGEVVEGQDQIDNNLDRKFQTISKIATNPVANVYEPAARAIEEADLIVLCPGDLYGSLLCNLVVPGIKEAIGRSKGKIVYITNLMTKVNQTHGWKASQFIDEINSYLSRPIDYAVINTGKLSTDITGSTQYASEHWEMVENDIEGSQYGETKVIQDNIWFEGQEYKRVVSDVIPRSFIRHNPAKLTEITLNILDQYV